MLGLEGLDPNGFFKVTDLREAAEREQEATVPEILRIAEQMVDSESEPEAELGNDCNK